jgi:hypothetical protein
MYHLVLHMRRQLRLLSLLGKSTTHQGMKLRLNFHWDRSRSWQKMTISSFLWKLLYCLLFVLRLRPVLQLLPGTGPLQLLQESWPPSQPRSHH